MMLLLITPYSMYYQSVITLPTLRLKALIVLIDKVQSEARANGTDE